VAARVCRQGPCGVPGFALSSTAFLQAGGVVRVGVGRDLPLLEIASLTRLLFRFHLGARSATGDSRLPNPRQPQYATACVLPALSSKHGRATAGPRSPLSSPARSHLGWISP
jgi:hypothetical protein